MVPRLLLRVLVAAVFISGLSFAQQQFSPADPCRELTFPKDYGKHPDFLTEWWYFTGNLQSSAGLWGFQLTLFRRTLAKEALPRESRWAVRDLYPAHFALTDITGGRFFYSELVAREGPGLAEAASDDLNVRVRDWTAVRHGDEIHISAREGPCTIDLKLRLTKAKALHWNSGCRRIGDAQEIPVYYYSFTRLNATGTLTFQGVPHDVTGTAWMDHQFGSSLLLEDHIGWDFFSLQLADGSELMVVCVRKKDGSIERPLVTFVPKDGPLLDLTHSPIHVSSQSTWTSPHTGAVYPSKWLIQVPSLDLTLRVHPSVPDQELLAGTSTGVVYWEGAVEAHGTRDGNPVNGRGYVELTGYAGSMAGRL